MPASPQEAYEPVQRPRLPFLDGIRGLASLYVLLHHASLMVPPDHLGRPALALRFLFRHGHSAVALFIVLSGFCLMLPVARDPNSQLANGPFGYLQRRARRILPPYYAMLACTWLALSLVPALATPGQSRFDRALPATTPGVVASHLLLVHNLHEHWLFKIDPPMWSVATEWQIYLLFPLLLIVWRKVGTVGMVAAAFALGYTVAAFAPLAENLALRYLCPWYLGLFALGMAAALACTAQPLARAPSARRPVLLSALLVLLALATAGITLSQYHDQNILIADALIGALTAVLLVRWTRLADPDSPAPRIPIFRLLEARWTLALGAFSYSLYLIHYPLLALADAGLREHGLSPDLRLGALILFASPLCILAAVVFHRAFERPFLPKTSHATADEPTVLLGSGRIPQVSVSSS